MFLNMSLGLIINIFQYSSYDSRVVVVKNRIRVYNLAGSTFVPWIYICNFILDDCVLNSYLKLTKEGRNYSNAKTNQTTLSVEDKSRL